MKLKKHGIVLRPRGEIGAIFNCGGIEHEGSITLLPRVVKKGYKKRKRGGFYRYVSEIWLGKSGDGKKFTLSQGPVIKPSEPYVSYGSLGFITGPCDNVNFLPSPLFPSQISET